MELLLKKLFSAAAGEYLMIPHDGKERNMDGFRNLNEILPFFLFGMGNHVPQMDEEMGILLKGAFHQSNIDIFAIPAVSDERKTKGRFDRIDSLNTLSHVS